MSRAPAIARGENTPVTVLHKFALVNESVTYRATGAVAGGIPWINEALNEPHALTFLSMPAPHPTEAGQFTWTYSGLHMLEVTGLESGAPQLHLQGVIKTDEPTSIPMNAPYVWPNRVALHGDGVFAVSGNRFFSSLWQELPEH
jgi:hypothetical protein